MDVYNVARGPKVDTRWRVTIVDDHEVVRAGLSRLLTRDLGLLVVGSLRTGEEALEALDVTVPDVVILDHHLPGRSGTEICEEILQRSPSTSVLILTAFPTEEVVRASLVAGARGVLAKNGDAKDLCAAVRAAAQGTAVLGPEAFTFVAGWADRSNIAPFDHRSLTDLETQVLRLVSQGMSNRDTGDRLRVSQNAVKLHLRSAMRKLGVSRRLEAVAAGIERGVI